MEKKAHRLEDQLAAEKAGLITAKKVLADAQAKVADELAAVEAKYKEADLAVEAAVKADSKARAEAISRLGLTPARARKAVLAWAGLAKNEEMQALIRGSHETLNNAVKALIAKTVDADAVVRAAEEVRDQAYKARRPLSEKRDALIRTYHREERAVRDCEMAISALERKIHERDVEKAAREAKTQTSPPPSKEDTARFIEARRRLTVIGARYKQNDPEVAKLPKFVWPPQD